MRIRTKTEYSSGGSRFSTHRLRGLLPRDNRFQAKKKLPTNVKKNSRHLIYFDVNVSLRRIVKRILARSECDEKWWGENLIINRRKLNVTKNFSIKKKIRKNEMTNGKKNILLHRTILTKY